MEQAIRLEQGKTYIVKEARTSHPFIIKITVLEITETTYYLKNNDTGIKYRALITDFLYNHNICEEIIPAVNAECPDEGPKEISPALYSDKKIPVSKYFEVLAYNVKGDTYWLKTDGYYHNGRGDVFYKYEPLYAEPWSVKRSSDGTVFTIHDLEPERKVKIINFLIMTDNIEIVYEDDRLTSLKHCKAPAEPTHKKQVCPGKKYSQSEVEAIRKDAFKSAREIKCDIEMPQFNVYKFNAFSDYLSSLNINTNDTGKENNESKSANWRRENLSASQPTEQTLNSKWQRDWEIQSFLKGDSTLQLSNYKYRDELNSIGLANCLSFKLPINAVKRLTDNEVFTIGDNDQFGTITGFEIAGDCIFVQHERGQSQLCYLVKTPKNSQKESPAITKGDDVPFFIADDGKNIPHMGGCVIVELPSCKIYKTIKINNIKRPNQVYFSTYHAARWYVIENSPISIKELQEIQNSNNTNGHDLIGHAISLVSSRVPYIIPPNE